MTSKKLFASSLVYTTLGFLAPAVNFFLIPIYSKALTPSDFGIITLATLGTSVLVNISGMGITGAFSRFYYDVLDDKKKIKNLFSTSLLSIVLFTGLLTLLLPLVGQHVLDVLFKNDQFTIAAYGLLMVFTALFTNLQMLVQSLYRNEEKVKLYSFWSVVFFISVVIGIYWGVVVMEKGAIGNVAGRMWGMLVPSAAFLLYFLAGNKLSFSIPLAKRMLVYGLPLVFYLLLTLAFNSIDKVMLERYLSLEALGIYGFSYLVATVIEILINAVNSAVTPQVFRMLKEGDLTSMSRIRAMISGNILAILFVIVWIMALCGPAVGWFIDSRYHESIYYMPLLAAAYIPRLLFTYYGIPFFYYHKTKVLPWISAISLVAGIILNMLLLPLMGIYGVCLAVFLTRLIQCIMAWAVSKRMGIMPDRAFYLKNELILSFCVVTITAVSLAFQQQVSMSWKIWAYMPMAIIYTSYLLFYITKKGWWKKLPLISNG